MMRLLEPGEIAAQQRAKSSRFYLGLDLGQSQDYSALVILERQGFTKETYTFLCRHLQRWPLQTSYPAIVADTARIVSSRELRSEHKSVLAVDATGVGAPVVDLFRRERMNAQLEPIQITGGDSVTKDSGVTRVPKRDLVSAAQVAFQSGKLRIAPTLPEAQVLVRELQNFQVKINLETAHDSYGAWREGAHDDLVLALALALWTGTQPRSVCYVFNIYGLRD
jgi:phage FluMu gp28-like protein